MIQARSIRVAAVGAACALLLAGCASGPDVRGDYDKAANFGGYKTYNFVQQDGPGGARSLGVTLMQNAADREMQQRGYVKAENADLLLNFKGKIEEKTDIESHPSPTFGPGWGYGAWYGAPYGGWGGTEVTTRRYNVGTLVMDVVDREKRQVVYQGSVEGIVTKEMMQNREASLNAAVAHIFAKYPFVAGQATPVPLPDAKK